MKRMLICSTSLALIAGASQAANIDAKAVAELFAKAGGDVAKVYISSDGSKIPRSKLPPDKQSALLEETLTEYSRQQNSFYAASSAAKLGKVGVEAAFGGLAIYGAAVATAAAAPVVLPAAAIVVSAGVALSFDILADTTEKAAENQGRLYLAGRKDEILAAVGMQSYAEVRGNISVAKERYRQSTGVLEDLRDRSVGDQNLRNFAVDLIFDNLAATDDLILDDLAAKGERLDSVEKRLTDFTIQLNDFRVSTQTQLDAHSTALGNLSDKFSRLEESVALVDEKVSRLGRDQAFIADFVLDQMSPAEKVNALKGGFLSERFECKTDVAECEGAKLKDALIERFQTEADIQDTLKTANTALRGMADISKIATNLGVPLPEEFSQAISFGSAATEAFASWTSGNPLGAVASISGVFGGRKDPDAERHRVMMAYLAKQFEQINRKLDQILENQKKILEAVVSLNQEMREGFAAMDRRLIALQFDVDTLSSNVRSIIWAPWQSCNAIFVAATRTTPSGQYSYLNQDNRKFKSFDMARNFGRSWSDTFESCQLTMVNNMSSFNALQWFGSFLDARLAQDQTRIPDSGVVTSSERDDVRGRLQRYEDDIFTPARLFAEQAAERAGVPSTNMFAALSTPAPTIRDFEAQWEMARIAGFNCSNSEERFRRLRDVVCGKTENREVIAKRLLQRPLLADVALDVSEWILIVSQLADIYNGDTKQFYASLEALIGSTPTERGGKWLIDKAIMTIDLVVASYNQTHGPLPALGARDALDACERATTDEKNSALFIVGESAIKLMKRNPYLAENVATLILDRTYRQKWRKDGDMRAANESSYRAAWRFAEQSPEDRFFLMDGLFPGLKFTLPENKPPVLVVNCRAETIEIPFPAPDQFSNGRFVFPSKFYGLLKMRDQLVDRYLNYHLLDKIPVNERDEFALTLMR
ncbi:hypothetical protein [Agrobacterium sp. El2ro-1b]|uniref:hypothetical protein n=1 Tax=Agrobacterium sp. El2ro-1b TaxID=2969528 RepID=UPI003AAE4F0C